MMIIGRHTHAYFVVNWVSVRSVVNDTLRLYRLEATKVEWIYGRSYWGRIGLDTVVLPFMKVHIIIFSTPSTSFLPIFPKYFNIKLKCNFSRIFQMNFIRVFITLRDSNSLNYVTECFREELGNFHWTNGKKINTRNSMQKSLNHIKFTFISARKTII